MRKYIVYETTVPLLTPCPPLAYPFHTALIPLAYPFHIPLPYPSHTPLIDTYRKGSSFLYSSYNATDPESCFSPGKFRLLLIVCANSIGTLLPSLSLCCLPYMFHCCHILLPHSAAAFCCPCLI